MYNPGRYQLGFIWTLHGSVFPRACAYAVPAAVLAVIIKTVHAQGEMEFLGYEKDKNLLLSNNAAYSGFSFVVGFLLVFRTSQAYTRFWDGATKVQEMRSKWCDACSSLIAFSRKSTKDTDEVMCLQHLIVRLFSLLHSVSLSQIHGDNDNFEVIDLAYFNTESLVFLQRCAKDLRVEVVSSWIHQLIVDNIDTGMLPVPAPILSRVFQEMSNGMVNMQNALKISCTPFPFPYAQMTTVLLLLHWAITPVLMSMWTSHWCAAMIFTFAPVFSFWCINLIAVEIEQPFGDDINDLPTEELQREMNNTLLFLLEPELGQVPKMLSIPTQAHVEHRTCFFEQPPLEEDERAVLDVEEGEGLGQTTSSSPSRDCNSTAFSSVCSDGECAIITLSSNVVSQLSLSGPHGPSDLRNPMPIQVCSLPEVHGPEEFEHPADVDPSATSSRSLPSSPSHRKNGTLPKSYPSPGITDKASSDHSRHSLEHIFSLASIASKECQAAASNMMHGHHLPRLQL